MSRMEAGFGWDYPPGMPGPHTETVEIECQSGHTFTTAATTELGGTFLEQEECPECGLTGDDLEVKGEADPYEL